MIDSAMAFGLILATAVLPAVLASCMASGGSGATADDRAGKAREPVQHVYKSVGKHRLVLKVYVPADAAPGDARPAIVFFFGGGFVGGRLTQFDPHCRYLAGRGMVAVAAEYRVKERHGSTPVDSCIDGRAAVRWLRGHAADLGIDPRRIAAGGGSAGGTVAAMARLMDEKPPEGEPQISARPDALVLFNPAVVYAPIDDRELRPEERLELYVQRWQRSGILDISAWHHVTSDAPPTLIHHGDKDAICPIETVRLFEKKMKAHGVRCELKVYEGQGHGFFNAGRAGGTYYRRTLAATDRFLASLGYLEGEPTIGDPADGDR